MATLNVNIENIAESINNMKKNEVETLLLLLSQEGRELLKRKRGIEEGKIKTITRDEVFGV